jgi:hypothetical protein
MGGAEGLEAALDELGSLRGRQFRVGNPDARRADVVKKGEGRKPRGRKGSRHLKERRGRKRGRHLKERRRGKNVGK